VFDDPQVRARGMRLDLAHPLAGSVPQVSSPFRLDGVAANSDRPPPLLGEHTAAVLREALGYDDARIDALARAGIVHVRR